MRQATVVTIGNFDGVHRGHQSLLARARELAGPDGRVLAFCFDPHPATVLRPTAVPQRLTTPDQRRRLLIEHGADGVIFMAPQADFLALAPGEFLDRVVMPHRPDAIVEGPDFRFGADRAGSVESLRELGPARGFRVEVVHAVEVELSDQAVVGASSSLLRWLIAHGRVADVRRVLGRAYTVQGTVQQGAQRGRRIGIPTVNVSIETMRPHDGVYAGSATDPDGHTYPAAINVGVRPTFGASKPTMEAHLIGWDGRADQYGWTTRIHFDRFLRDEIRFTGPDQVAAQIRRDLERVMCKGAGMAVAI